MSTAFYSVLNHSHSIVRWLLLAALVLSLIWAVSGLISRKGISHSGRIICRVTVYIAHLQVVIGLLLYIISPKVIFAVDSMHSSVLRFFLVEHITAMLISVAFITLGYITMKKAETPVAGARKIFWYFLVSLVIILAMIPWPFMSYGAHWM